MHTLAETSCQLERQMAKTMDDAFVPECKQDGSYSDMQCFEHEGFAKQCWCVTGDGQEIQGTRMSDGQLPNCTTAVRDEDKHHDEKQEYITKAPDTQLKSQHHDEPVQPQHESPSQNQKTMEVEIQIIRNRTQTGRFVTRQFPSTKTTTITSELLNLKTR